IGLPELEVAAMRKSQRPLVPLEGTHLGESPGFRLPQTAVPVDVPGKGVMGTPRKRVGDAPGTAGRGAASRGDERSTDSVSILLGHSDCPSSPMADAVHPPPLDPCAVQHVSQQLEVAPVDLTVEHGRDDPAVDALDVLEFRAACGGRDSLGRVSGPCRVVDALPHRARAVAHSSRLVPYEGSAYRVHQAARPKSLEGTVLHGPARMGLSSPSVGPNGPSMNLRGNSRQTPGCSHADSPSTDVTFHEKSIRSPLHA